MISVQGMVEVRDGLAWHRHIRSPVSWGDGGVINITLLSTSKYSRNI